jgi:hypothetical protein
MMQQTPKYTQDAARAFARLFCTEVGKLSPLTPEEVLEKQNTATQRHATEAAADLVGGMAGKSSAFQKTEAYPLGETLKPARNISEMPKHARVQVGSLAYPLADAIKAMPWYSFGKHPRVVSERIARVCAKAKTICLHDFSKFDGTVGDVFRQIELIILESLFGAEGSTVWKLLHSKQFRTKYGVEYEQLLSQASGDFFTSTFNTLRNALVVFLTLTTRKVNRLTYEQAWQALRDLAVLGGDDGFVGDIDIADLQTVCNTLGIKATGEVIPRGSKGVNFLGRFWPTSVFSGQPESCSDVPRQIAKLHVTSQPSTVPCWTVALDKALSFAQTDTHTPLLSTYAFTLLRAAFGEQPSSDQIRHAANLRTIGRGGMSWLASQFEGAWPTSDVTDEYIEHWGLCELNESLLAWSNMPAQPSAETGVYAGYVIDVGAVKFMLNNLPEVAPPIIPKSAPMAHKFKFGDIEVDIPGRAPSDVLNEVKAKTAEAREAKRLDKVAAKTAARTERKKPKNVATRRGPRT